MSRVGWLIIFLAALFIGVWGAGFIRRYTLIQFVEKFKDPTRAYCIEYPEGTRCYQVHEVTEP
jgi:hypothetical protein